MSRYVSVGNGRILLPHDTYERYLSGIDTAVLLERDGRTYLMPLLGPTAGGMLLKQRNPQGDRVLLATDFLHERGLGPFSDDRQFEVQWDADVSALLINGLGTADRACQP